jgi:hypothetical protein
MAPLKACFRTNMPIFYPSALRASWRAALCDKQLLTMPKNHIIITSSTSAIVNKCHIIGADDESHLNIIIPQNS